MECVTCGSSFVTTLPVYICRLSLYRCWTRRKSANLIGSWLARTRNGWTGKKTHKRCNSCRNSDIEFGLWLSKTGTRIQAIPLPKSALPSRQSHLSRIVTSHHSAWIHSNSGKCTVNAWLYPQVGTPLKNYYFTLHIVLAVIIL